MAVGAVGNCGVCGFQAPVDARCVHGERRRPRPWCSGTLASSGLPPYALGRRRRGRLPRQRGGGFRSDPAGGRRSTLGWTSAVCRAGRRETMRAEQNHDAWNRRGRDNLDRTGRHEPIREREAAPSQLALARDGDGGFWPGSWPTNSREVLPAVSVPESPFRSPEVLCGTAFSPTKPGFIEVLDCRERVQNTSQPSNRGRSTSRGPTPPRSSTGGGPRRGSSRRSAPSASRARRRGRPARVAAVLADPHRRALRRGPVRRRDAGRGVALAACDGRGRRVVPRRGARAGWTRWSRCARSRSHLWRPRARRPAQARPSAPGRRSGRSSQPSGQPASQASPALAPDLAGWTS